MSDPDILSIGTSSANLQAKLDAYVAQVAELGSTIAALQTLDSDFANLLQIPLLTNLKQFSDTQLKSGWKLAKGTVGNTGATGSPGAATLPSPISDGSANVTIHPAGPNYDCYLWLDLPYQPSPWARLFWNRVDYLFPTPGDLKVSQGVENEIKWYDGKLCWDMAWQARLKGTNAGFWHYFNYIGKAHPVGVDGWINSGIPVVFNPGVPVVMDALFLLDPISKLKTHVGLIVDGIFHPVGYQEPAVPNTAPPRFLTSVQLDSDKTGSAYTCNFRNSGAWL